MIRAFIDELRAEGYTVESICRVLREQGLQIVSRLRARTFLLPEDAALLQVPASLEEAPLVRRCAAVWRNDVENLPLFLALALSWVLAGAPAREATS